VGGGETVLDPEVLSTLMRRGRSPLAALTARERDVLELIAQGDRNGEIAAKLHVTETVIKKHIRNIFSKLGLLADEAGHRRVLAVLTYLRGQQPSSAPFSANSASSTRSAGDESAPDDAMTCGLDPSVPAADANLR
jgi:DNA-binding NarL/FixJ family response regulator